MHALHYPLSAVGNRPETLGLIVTHVPNATRSLVSGVSITCVDIARLTSPQT